MIYAKVDTQQKAALDAAMNTTTDAKWYRRLKIIDLSGQGFSVPELSLMFDLNTGTIRRYIHAYNEAGLDGLQPEYGRGRPPVLTWSKAQWLDLLAQSPADLELLNTGSINRAGGAVSLGRKGGRHRKGYKQSQHCYKSPHSDYLLKSYLAILYCIY